MNEDRIHKLFMVMSNHPYYDSASESEYMKKLKYVDDDSMNKVWRSSQNYNLQNIIEELKKLKPNDITWNYHLDGFENEGGWRAWKKEIESRSKKLSQ